jgi:hypothetical protein
MKDESVVRGRIGLWARVSSTGQEMDSQEEGLNAFLARNKLVGQKWYLDPDRPRSGASESAKLAELFRDAEAGRLDWLVMTDQSRLGTFDHIEFNHYIYRFRRARVRVYSVADGELTSADIGSSFQSLAKSHAEIAEQTTKAGRVARGLYLNAQAGRYVGAMVPIGYDRVCITPDGSERFRVVEEAREINPGYVRGSKKAEERKYVRTYTIIYPSGHSEHLQTTPGKSKTDRYEYCLSVKTDRIEAAREVFALYDSGMNFHEIARGMNRLGRDCGHREEWTATIVRDMLANPIYSGVVEWRKTTRAKYMSINSDGSLVPSDWNPAFGRIQARRTKASERVRSEPDDSLRIVDQGLFDRVQARLAGRHTRRTQPRADSLWLRPFLRCAHCKGPMHGIASSGTEGRSYFRCAANLRSKAAGVEPECVGNTIRLEVVEARLRDFLQEFGHGVKVDLGTADPRIANLAIPYAETGVAVRAVHKEMLEYVKARMPASELMTLGVAGHASIADVYRYYHAKENAAGQGELAAIMDSIRRLTRGLLRVDEGSEAERIIREDLREAEARKREFEARSVPLDRKLDELLGQLQSIDDAIRDVLRLSASQRLREAAEALGTVLDVIDVWSVPSGGASGVRGERFPDKLIFYPKAGDPVAILAGPPSGAISPAAEARARELLHQGENLNRICAILTAEGFTPPRGGKWERSSLKRRLAADLAALPPEARDGRSRLHPRNRRAKGEEG